MKNKIMKSLVVSLLALIIAASSSNAFANPTGEKRIKKANVSKKHPKTVKVTVNKNGFSPSTINVEKGYPLTLVFYRATREGCGTEVVFPALNIRKKLPLKKNITVKFTPKESDEINFSCGMNMMKGKIIAN